MADQEPLDLVAVQLPEELALLLGLDTLGHHREPECVPSAIEARTIARSPASPSIDCTKVRSILIAVTSKRLR